MAHLMNSDSPKSVPTFLVTGGSGFIATWVLRELLHRGYAVVALDTGDRPARWNRILGREADRISFYQTSLLNRESLREVFEKHPISHVIHLAALLTPACEADPFLGCQVNVLGTVALLEAMRASPSGVRGFSYASSVAVFGDEPGGKKRDEASASSEPLTFYGAFKKSVEMIAAQYWRAFRIPSVGLRPQVAYGPERDVGLTAGPSLAVKAAVEGRPYTIGYTGCVGYDYVEDCSHGFVRAAMEPPSGAVVADLSGERVDTDAVVQAIESVLPEARGQIKAQGPVIPAHAPPSPWPLSRLYPDWKTTSLLEGIRRTAQFYRSATPH